jgi:hypothetical protein
MDLFSTVEAYVPSSESSAAPDSVASAETMTPQPLGFTAFWGEYRATLLDAERRISAICAKGASVFQLGYSPTEDLRVWSQIRETRKRITDAIYSLAERTFAPAGGSLSIDRSGVRDELPDAFFDESDEDAFDPDLLWRLLERKFGGDAGRELGLRQLAARLVREFGLAHRPPVRKANRLILTDKIYTEKSWNGSHHEFGISSSDGIRRLINDLSEFCEWSGDIDTARRLRVTGSGIRYGARVESRERFDCGAISFVTYLQKMEYEIYGDLADSFQVFISTHGRAALQAR